MRNWPYAYSVSQAGAVKGKFDVTVLPHTGRNPSVGTVGGWLLGVSKYSKNIAGRDGVRPLHDEPGAQKFNAIYNTNVPTIPAVAKDPAVVKVNPWLKPAIANVARVTRPTQLGAKYQQGSQVIYQGINQILNGQDAKNVLPRIEQQLDRLAEAIGAAANAFAHVRKGRSVAPVLPRASSIDATVCRAPSPRPPRRRRATVAGRPGSARKQTRLAWVHAHAGARGRRVRRDLPARPDHLPELHRTSSSSQVSSRSSSSGSRTTATCSNDTIFRDSVWLTVKFTVITVAFELVLGMIIALVVNSGFKGRGVMRAVMLVPWAIPTVVAAQMWKWMYNDIFGVINDVARPAPRHRRAGVAWIAERARRSRRSASSTSGRRPRSSRCSCSRACR